MMMVLTWTGMLCLFARAEAPSTQTTETTPVTRGTITALIEADGYLEPIEPVEIRVRPESYQGDLKVKSVAPHGSAVRSGDVILAIDPSNLNRQLSEAENTLVAARAALVKAESDEYLGEQADALALQQARDELANAEASLKWWEDVDGKQMLKTAELGVRNARNSVEDQTDELDQLKKMYKTEDLTNATSEIVIKRAVRQLDLAKIMHTMSEWREGKVKNFDYTIARQRLIYGIEAEKQQLAQLKAQQDLQRVQRKTALASARMGLEKAEVKVNELKSDAEAFAVSAPADGVVYYGQLTGGSWQNSGPKAVRSGEKITAGNVVMTLAQPGRLRLVVDIPESKVSWVSGGSEARISPVALPELATTGKCQDIAPVGGAREGGQGFVSHFDVPLRDPKLLPGMKASVRIDGGTSNDVLVVPTSAITKGRVKVKEDDKEVWRDVVVGRSEGESTEIRHGLKEGELVITKVSK
jgi:multidrug efflux pump subunit AcrA (membrane-fusion protein)